MVAVVQDECRAKLDEDRAELQLSIEELERGEMSAEEAAEAMAVIDELLETLKEIDDALSKIGLGTYGSCESCKGPIGDERLVAMPAARFCLACAEVMAVVLTSTDDVD